MGKSQFLRTGTLIFTHSHTGGESQLAPANPYVAGVYATNAIRAGRRTQAPQGVQSIGCIARTALGISWGMSQGAGDPDPKRPRRATKHGGIIPICDNSEGGYDVLWS